MVSMFLVKEALASCNIERAGKPITLSDYFLAVAEAEHKADLAARRAERKRKRQQIERSDGEVSSRD